MSNKFQVMVCLDIKQTSKKTSQTKNKRITDGTLSIHNMYSFEKIINNS